MKATKNMYVYYVYDLDNKLVYEGLLNDVADYLQVDSRNITQNAKLGCRVFGEYRIKKKLRSIVGNSYMTMLADIEKHGVSNTINKTVKKLAKFTDELNNFKKSKNNNQDLLDTLIDVELLLDEVRIILNLNSDSNLTNKKLEDAKRERLKVLAEKLEID